MGRRRRMMLPRVNESLSPPFHEMTEYPFQDLCCELFGRQEGIATCEVYGTRGQKQRGIDLWAQCVGGNGSEVGQCKCYKAFSRKEIEKASDEFFAHLAYWQERHVQRFILFVACDLDDTRQQEEVQKQITRFAEYSIRYEAWSARTLRSKLGPHRDIVTRHLKSDYWVEHICGLPVRSVVEQTPEQSHSQVTMRFLSAQLERLASSISHVLEAQVEAIRECYRKGRKREALTQLRTLQRDPDWDLLEKPLQARILRTIAAYTLHIDTDIATASTLALQAQELDPSADDTIFRVLLHYYTVGPEKALQEIGTAGSIDVLNLEVALLLELGRSSEAQAKLESLPPGLVADTETRRLGALLSLTNGDLLSAQAQIQRVAAEQPEWEAIRITSAIIDYASALSPAVIPHHTMTWPQPIDWAFVRRDNESLQHLRRAESDFATLSSDSARDDDLRRWLEVWRLACLANDPDRQAEAERFCLDLLQQNSMNHRALAWALARSYVVDLDTSERALEEALKEDIDGGSEQPT